MQIKARSRQGATSLAKLAKISAPAAITFILMGSQGAFAAATGIAALDNMDAVVQAVVTGLAWFATLTLLAVLVWDFISHRNVGRSMFEFVGVVILGVIAFNANAIIAQLNVAGATL